MEAACQQASPVCHLALETLPKLGVGTAPPPPPSVLLPWKLWEGCYLNHPDSPLESCVLTFPFQPGPPALSLFLGPLV